MLTSYLGIYQNALLGRRFFQCLAVSNLWVVPLIQRRLYCHVGGKRMGWIWQNPENTSSNCTTRHSTIKLLRFCTLEIWSTNNHRLRSSPLHDIPERLRGVHHSLPL